MPANMKNINLYLCRGQNGFGKGYSDQDMVKIDVQDKKGLHLLKAKIVCEEFEGIIEYELFIDDQSFLQMGYNKNTKEYYKIDYNEDFKGGK